MSFDFGTLLAQRLVVPPELVSYQRISDSLDGMKVGAVDFTAGSASPAPAEDVAFSPTLLSLELGYLVPSSSPIRNIADVNHRGVRVGVTQGSTSERTLPLLMVDTRVVPATNLKVAIDMLGRHELARSFKGRRQHAVGGSTLAPGDSVRTKAALRASSAASGRPCPRRA